jgi:SAM-dependent methyltransferase
MSIPRSGELPSPPRPGGSLLDTVLAAVLDDLAGTASLLAHSPVVLDCGGGSGSRAVPLAVRGAMVTVIDSSIDALAILGRRAAEAGVGDRIQGVQADVESLAEVVGPASADLVLVHGVLDVTREPAQVVAAAAAAVRTGGYLSVVVPNPVAAVLARALAGDLSSALAELTVTDTGGTTPRPGAGNGLDLDGLRSLVETAGLEVTATQGLGAFSSSVPGSVLDGQPDSRAALAELDRRGAMRSPYREIAGRLHLLARRPRPDADGT